MSSMSRFSCLLRVTRRANYCLSTNKHLSQWTWRPVSKSVQRSTILQRTSSHLPTSCKCYTVSAGDSKTDALSSGKQPESEHSENFPANKFWRAFDFKSDSNGSVHNKDFSSVCQNMYFYLSKNRPIQSGTFYEFMKLVDKKASFELDEARLAIRTLGSINRMLSKGEKVQWTNYLTEKFADAGVPLDDVYFNIILNNYLQQWISFSPVEFLSLMEKHGATPTAVTFEKFITVYSRNGDLQSVSQVLEHMRANDIPISNKAYAALIYGNFVARDKETAMSFFRETVQNGFQMNDSVYMHAVLGLAMMGDLDGVQEMVEECKENSIFLTSPVLCAVLSRVATTGNQQMFNYFLGLLKEEGKINKYEVMDSVFDMMQTGNFDHAYELFTVLKEALPSEFFQKVAFSDMPVKSVLQFHERFVKNGFADVDLIDYYEHAIAMGKYERAVEIFPHIAKGKSLRGIDTWPLIRYYAILNDLKGLETILPYVKPYCIDQQVNPALRQMNVSDEQYEQLLKDNVKITPEELKGCMLLWTYQRNNDISEVHDLVKTYKSYADIHDKYKQMIYLKLHQAMNKQNWDKVLEIINHDSSLKEHSMLHALKAAKKYGATSEQIKTFLLEKDVTLSERYIPDEIKTDLSEEELKKIVGVKPPIGQMMSMPLDELMLMKNQMSNNLVYNIAVLSKMSFMDSERFEEQLACTDIKRINNVRLLKKIATFYSLKDETLDKCLETLELVFSNDNKKSYDFRDFVLIQNLCAHGCHAEVSSLLDNCDGRGFKEDKKKFTFSKDLFDMKPTAENFELAKNILFKLHDNDLMTRTANVRRVCQMYLGLIEKSNDWSLIFDEVEMLNERFDTNFRCMISIFEKAILSNDKAALQTAFDKFTQKEIEHDVLANLAAAFLLCGFQDKARKVLTTPGLRIGKQCLNSIANYWIYQNKGELLEQFFELVKFLPSFNKADAVFYKLKLMWSQPNVDIDKCIEFYETKFDEEEVFPQQHHVREFSKVLKTYDRVLKQNEQISSSNMPQVSEEPSVKKPSKKAKKGKTTTVSEPSENVDQEILKDSAETLTDNAESIETKT
ncbi:hypothetical protein ACF0H5_002052 [Mactra antiquata]